MKKRFIIRRILLKEEKRKVVVEDWSEAVKKLAEFVKEPILDDCVLDHHRATVEFIGDVE